MTEFEQNILNLVGDIKSELADVKAQNSVLTQGIKAIALDAQKKNEIYKEEIAKRDEEFAKVYKYLTENLSYRNLVTSSKSGISDIFTKEDMEDFAGNFQLIVNLVENSEKSIEKRLRSISSAVSMIRK